MPHRGLSLGSRATLVTLALAGLVISGCASDSRPDPKETVKGLFAAMRASDSLYLERHVDLAAAVATLGEDLPAESAGADPGAALLAALTGEGTLRKRWLENQIVVGGATLVADTAWVEVSFIDRLTRVQYYNKMRLDFRGDHWVINAFRTM
ncbi:MAG TPA: hypothetical protein VNN55_12300 [bacterium]|nr:hypothetical protein [bacterium]